MSLFDNIRSLVSYINSKQAMSEYIFISLGKEDIKAKVIRLKSSGNIVKNIYKECEKFKRKTGTFPKWMKVDIIVSEEKVLFDDLKIEMENRRRNYIDYGIGYDSNYIFYFLPEEINANAFVRPTKDRKSLYFSEENINSYLSKYRYSHLHKKGANKPKPYSHNHYIGKQVNKFYTQSYFFDGEEIFELESKGARKGLRIVEDISTEIDKLIESGTLYLKNQLRENGMYNYGYFPHFDREINFYNNLRHCSSTYSLIEGLSYLNEEIDIAKSPLGYIINNQFYEHDGAGYVFDSTNNMNEIKLGQNAAFVFAICEYLKYHPKETELLEKAQLAANGILNMIDLETSETIHVLNYPDLTVKDNFRVIYYDGEAALALLRLYQIDGNDKWLDAVKGLFNKFIEQDYWKYHDHWLGYCTNELVKIVNKKEYYIFGIKNVSGYLDFIDKRETTFPTFLEMLTSTYQLLQSAKQAGYKEEIEELIDEKYFTQVIHHRAEYQRVGYFYPEVAMYFKNPKRILGSFFIKHHGYRTRIDDIEHYLSGYVQYQKIFKNDR